MTVDPDPRPAGTPELVLHEERLRVGDAVGTAAERVVVRRRIVSEVRQVPVTVSREVLEVTREPLVGASAADDGGAPLTIVLSEQVPVVELRTRPYERVTVSVERTEAVEQVSATLAREQVDVATEDLPAGR